MKRTFLPLFSILFLLTFLFCTCNKEPVQGVSVEPSIVYLAIGETVTLNATIMPLNAANKNVSWESSDNSVASVQRCGKPLWAAIPVIIRGTVLKVLL